MDLRELKISVDFKCEICSGIITITALKRKLVCPHCNNFIHVPLRTRGEYRELRRPFVMKNCEKVKVEPITKAGKKDKYADLAIAGLIAVRAFGNKIDKKDFYKLAEAGGRGNHALIGGVIKAITSFNLNVVYFSKTPYMIFDFEETQKKLKLDKSEVRDKLFKQFHEIQNNPLVETLTDNRHMLILRELYDDVPAVFLYRIKNSSGKLQDIVIKEFTPDEVFFIDPNIGITSLKRSDFTHFFIGDKGERDLIIVLKDKMPFNNFMFLREPYT